MRDCLHRAVSLALQEGKALTSCENRHFKAAIRCFSFNFECFSKKVAFFAKKS
jgi:hypothetical protein